MTYESKRKTFSAVLTGKIKNVKRRCCTIRVRITMEGSSKAEFSLGTKLHPGNRDQQAQRVKLDGTLPATEARQINAIIIQTLAEIQRHYFGLEYQFDGVTSEMIKKAYKGMLMLRLNIHLIYQKTWH